MSTDPLITVALPALNSEKTISQSIASILAQSFQDWELLIMDDGSQDSTVELARSFSDPRVKVIADGMHHGLPSQLNRAAGMARGKFFARMDADDLAYEDRFGRQANFLKQNPHVDVVAGWVTVFRSDGSLLGTRRFPTDHKDLCARPWRGIPMAHPTWMGRIEWFRANPYNEHMVRMEDRELLLRTYRSSCFAVIPEVLLAYREDSLSLLKLFIARKNTCKVAISLGITQRRVVVPALIVLGQCVRSVAEALAVPTGLAYKVLRNRALTPSARESQLWQELWARMGEFARPADAERVGC